MASRVPRLPLAEVRDAEMDFAEPANASSWTQDDIVGEIHAIFADAIAYTQEDPSLRFGAIDYATAAAVVVTRSAEPRLAGIGQIGGAMAMHLAITHLFPGGRIRAIPDATEAFRSLDAIASEPESSPAGADLRMAIRQHLDALIRASAKTDTPRRRRRTPAPKNTIWSTDAESALSTTVDSVQGDLDFAAAWKAFKDFALIKVSAPPPDELESDMFLFEPAMRGSTLELHFVRQFTFLDADGEYDHMEQLWFDFDFEFAAGEVPSIEVGFEWGDYGELEPWFEFVETSAAFEAAIAARVPSSIDIGISEI